MLEFKKEILTNRDIVVHCDTKEKAKELLKWAHSKGLRWSSGALYITRSNWEIYKEQTYYKLWIGHYGSMSSYDIDLYTVLTFEEALISNDYIDPSDFNF